jgi:hypothetical protein
MIMINKNLTLNLFSFVFAIILIALLSSTTFAWEQMPGSAIDISISPEGDVYVLGTSHTQGGNSIFKWTEDGWMELPGGGVSIAAASNGILWLIDNRSRIYRFIEEGWQKMPGTASDIAVGHDGSVFITGGTRCNSGREIYKFIPPLGWTKIPGYGNKISVSPEGVPWVVNSRGEVFKYNNGGLSKLEGAAVKIVIGKDDEIWAIGTTSCPGGHELFRYVDQGWVKMDGCAVDIEIAPDNTIWVINSKQEIFRKQF